MKYLKNAVYASISINCINCINCRNSHSNFTLQQCFHVALSLGVKAWVDACKHRSYHILIHVVKPESIYRLRLTDEVPVCGGG